VAGGNVIKADKGIQEHGKQGEQAEIGKSFKKGGRVNAE